MCCIALCVLYTTEAQAGGWPVGKGRWVWAPSFIVYYSKQYWDKDKVLHTLPDKDKFVSYYMAQYVDYGLSRKLDLIASIPVVYQKSIVGGIAHSAAGLGDVMLGLSYNFADLNRYTHLSIQGSAIIPAYKVNPDIPMGFGVMGAEARFTVAGGTGRQLGNAYYVLDAGYRYYFQTAGPSQFSYNVTVGIPINKYNQVGFDAGGLISSSTIKDFTPNINIGRDYSFFKVSAKYGRQISRTVSIYLSGYTTPAGRNMGKGYGGMASFICKF